MLPNSPAARPVPGHAGVLLRRVIGLVAIALMLIGQPIAGVAGTGGQDQGWIEICGETGVEYALVDLEYALSVTEPAPGNGGHDPADCVCADCFACMAGAAIGVAPAAGYAVETFDFSYMRWSADAGIVPEAAEQYWGQTRGPPEQGTSEHMTLSFESSSNEPVGPVAGMGGFPWA